MERFGTMFVLLSSRTESDEIVGCGISPAGKGAGGVIIGIAIGVRTGGLEDSGVVHGPVDRFARLRPVVGTPATVLIRVEPHARAHAGNGPA